MAKNPYTVLGVSPTADDDAVRAAFRKLAKKYHPDRNPGDKEAEERFKEASAAFDVVGDPETRKKFDRGEIDESGRSAGPFRNGQRGGFQGSYPGGGEGPWGRTASSSAGGASFDDLSDIFSDIFGGRRSGGQGGGQAGASGGGFQAGPVPRGRDARYRLEIDFLEAVNGGAKRVTMPDGRVLDIIIPAGLEDGQTLRLKGQGEASGYQGGLPGDVYVETTVRPHAEFERDGADIRSEVAISLKEAVLGGKITVRTISGDVALAVPKWTSSGAVLRLKGRGGPNGKGGRGDHYVRLKIALPEGGDTALEDFVKTWPAEDVRVRKTSADA